MRLCLVVPLLCLSTATLVRIGLAREDGGAATPSTGHQATVTNSIGMRLVAIPAGEFRMGLGQSDREFARALAGHSSYDPKTFVGHSLERERPPHLVRITKPFLLGTCHVTVAQFRAFVDASGYVTDAEKGTKTIFNAVEQGKGAVGFDAKTGDAPFREEYSWRNPGFPQGDNHPVVCISWNDAAAFCQWLSRKESKEYRLPTEAEWEYACRAGTDTLYWCGDDPESLAKCANVADAQFRSRYPKEFESHYALRASDGYVFTSPVGSFRPNSFGLYDMLGNACQWCSDRYDARYYAKSPVNDPKGSSAASERVLRGGCWKSIADPARSCYRTGSTPEFRTMATGFRVARTL